MWAVPEKHIINVFWPKLLNTLLLRSEKFITHQNFQIYSIMLTVQAKIIWLGQNKI